jgi:hypothetical protein
MLGFAIKIPDPAEPKALVVGVEEAPNTEPPLAPPNGLEEVVAPNRPVGGAVELKRLVDTAVDVAAVVAAAPKRPVGAAVDVVVAAEMVVVATAEAVVAAAAEDPKRPAGAVVEPAPKRPPEGAVVLAAVVVAAAVLAPNKPFGGATPAAEPNKPVVVVLEAEPKLVELVVVAEPNKVAVVVVAGEPKRLVVGGGVVAPPARTPNKIKIHILFLQ